MKQIKSQLKGLSLIQILIALLILGLALGALYANIFKESYFDQIASYNATVFKDIASQGIDYKGLFWYSLGRHFKELVIFWLLCFTILGIPYMIYRIVVFGFYTGFFISAATINYGFKGILLIIVYIFPHGLIYLPIALFSLYKGFTLCRSIYFENRNYLGNIKMLIKSHVIIFLLLSLLLLLGTFFETYIGAFLLKKTLGIII